MLSTGQFPRFPFGGVLPAIPRRPPPPFVILFAQSSYSDLAELLSNLDENRWGVLF